MYIVKVIGEEGYCIQERNAWIEPEIEHCKGELQVYYPNCKIVVEEYIPWTKERAEAEIAEKLKKEKKQTKSKKAKKEEE